MEADLFRHTIEGGAGVADLVTRRNVDPHRIVLRLDALAALASALMPPVIRLDMANTAAMTKNRDTRSART